MILETLIMNDLTLMLLVANLANTKWCKNPEKWLNPWHMGTHLRVLYESYPMITNMTGFRSFSKIFASLCFGWKIASALEGLKRLHIFGVVVVDVSYASDDPISAWLSAMAYSRSACSCSRCFLRRSSSARWLSRDAHANWSASDWPNWKQTNQIIKGQFTGLMKITLQMKLRFLRKS